MADDEPKTTPVAGDEKKKKSGLKALMSDFLFVLLQIGVELAYAAHSKMQKIDKFICTNPGIVIGCIVLLGSLFLNAGLIFKENAAFQNGHLINQLQGRADQSADVMYGHLSNLQYDVDYLRHMSQEARVMDILIAIATWFTLCAAIIISVMLIKMTVKQEQRHEACLAELVFMQKQMKTISDRISDLEKDDGQ